MTTVEILKAAKQRIVDKGWCQGEYQNYAGNFCMSGAVSRVAYRLAECIRARWILSKVCDANEIAWNDAPGRTVEQVLVKFDEAIKLAEVYHG